MVEEVDEDDGDAVCVRTTEQDEEEEDRVKADFHRDAFGQFFLSK